ncbi:MAG: RagB/SusD family nutrient uptake outer membrane protein [Bacteroidetes bacterium]|nr:MAG: RagB/SusD family nutrient uptake outer membrane protein [Bacteroidota bacterium]
MKLTIKTILASGMMFLATSCTFFEVEKVIDPNNPSLESFLSNPTLAQLDQMGVGVQFAMRGTLETVMGDFYRITGSFGREIYHSAATDNRWQTEILGTRPVDPAGIFNQPYNGFAQTRRRAELFAKSAETATILTEQEKQGIRGFANTVKAYVMLNQVNLQGSNGIRIAFNDLSAPGDMLKPGPFVSYEQALTEIKRVADLGADQLAGAGSAFAFTLTSGYNNFNTPTNYRKFNRAIAARVAMYQKDWAGMAKALSESFLDLNGSLTAGPVFTYSTAAGDVTNPFFKVANDANRPDILQPLFLTQAEAGDTRVTSKTRPRSTPRLIPTMTISFTHEAGQYASNTTSASIIRNEELVLMYAEAMVQTGNLSEAVKALDIVRGSAGLQALATAKPSTIGNKDALIDEVLNQRRYSLFFEGHRWFDMRRYNRLDKLPLDAASHQVYDKMPRLQSEIDWDARNPQ